MSRHETLLHVTIYIGSMVMLLAAVRSLDDDARTMLEALFGLGSAAAWAGSAYLYRNAILSARMNLVAAALAGAVCIIAVAPSAL